MSDLCPICSERGELVRTKVKANKPSPDPARPVGDADVSIFRCSRCELDYSELWDAAEEAIAFYADDAYVFRPNVSSGDMKFDPYGVRITEVDSYLHETSSVLDVGCGDGAFLRAIRDRVGSVTGCEVTASHISALRDEGINVWACPFREIPVGQTYDVITMYALLEHLPDIGENLAHMRRLMSGGSSVFIHVPNLRDPLVSYYDVAAFRDFYYRVYHLYYFTERSLRLLMKKHGFDCVISPLMQASLTNHFHWMHHGRGQETTNQMTSVTLPVPLSDDPMPSGRRFASILDRVDDLYRSELLENGVGDLLSCRAWLANGADA